VLGLLLLKPNRTAQVWWIWLPLALVAASEFLARAALDFIPSQVLEIFCQLFNSLGFGIAAVWLVANWLGHRLRFLVFLKVLAAMIVMTGFCFVVRQDFSEGGLETLGFAIYGGVCVLIATVALSLAGLLCRRRYRPVALTLWLAVGIAAILLAITTPFMAIASVASGGEAPWGEFLGGILVFAALTFGMFVPFLVLAFANGLFRERLKDLLHLRPASPPPVPAEPPPILSAGVQV
jgi:hypothetical protein